jgi:hypothetical protein
MTKPVRLQLSRAAGSNLQALSQETNGLPAVNVARPGFWGNPFVVNSKAVSGQEVIGATYHAVLTAVEAVARFRELLPQSADRMVRIAELRGKNLACWCKPSEPCHADVLLEIANR